MFKLNNEKTFEPENFIDAKNAVFLKPITKNLFFEFYLYYF